MNLTKAKLRISLGDVALDNAIHIRVNDRPLLDYDRVTRELRMGHGEPKNQVVKTVYHHMRVDPAYARTRDTQEVTLCHGEYAHANIDNVC